MAVNQTDRTALTEHFRTIFGTADHPLHEKLQNDLDGGRGLNAIMTDLREAQAHRARESNQDNPRLYIATL